MDIDVDVDVDIGLDVDYRYMIYGCFAGSLLRDALTATQILV